MNDQKSIIVATNNLWKEQTEAHWKTLSKELRRGGMKYYRIRYKKGGLKDAANLKKTVVELFDSRYRLVAKAPVYFNRKRGVRGATSYLQGLSINNRKN